MQLPRPDPRAQGMGGGAAAIEAAAVADGAGLRITISSHKYAPSEAGSLGGAVTTR